MRARHGLRDRVCGEATYTSAMPSTPIEPHFRVLVVDDEKNIRATLGVCLEGIGCTVTAVATSEAALAAADREAGRRTRLVSRLHWIHPTMEAPT